jgi:hypothetical protein
MIGLLEVDKFEKNLEGNGFALFEVRVQSQHLLGTTEQN